jgi:hypothetical protein
MVGTLPSTGWFMVGTLPSTGWIMVGLSVFIVTFYIWYLCNRKNVVTFL